MIKLFYILLLITIPLYSKELNIVTWNIQNLGNCKLANEKCSSNKSELIDAIHKEISKVFKDKDLIFIQEVSTTSSVKHPTINYFVKKVAPNMKWIISKDVGTTSGNKERFLTIYNPNKLTIENIDYIEKDCIIRSPFVIKFKELPIYFSTVHISAKKNLIIPELRCIEDYFNKKEFIVTGDTNADCSYYPRMKIDISKVIFNNSNWLIKTGEDTTVRNRTSCTYDRIIGSKNVIFKNYDIYKNFDGDEKFQLKISDHYPVSFKIEY